DRKRVILAASFGTGRYTHRDVVVAIGVVAGAMADHAIHAVMGDVGTAAIRIGCGGVLGALSEADVLAPEEKGDLALVGLLDRDVVGDLMNALELAATDLLGRERLGHREVA